jgi:SAM-dependent methyltransferase
MSVVGVDVVPPEKVSPFVKYYIRHDLEMPLNLPYGRDFNYGILSGLIEHIKDRDGLMNSLHRHLKPNGHLIASTGNVAIWFYRLSLLLGRFEYGPRGILDRTHVHLFTLDSSTRFFQQGGYTVLETKFTPIPFELVFSSTGRSVLIEWTIRWYYYLSIVWPLLFAYQFIVHCTFRSFESALGEEIWQPSRDQAAPEQSPGTARLAGLNRDTRGTRFPRAKKQALSGKVQGPED